MGYPPIQIVDEHDVPIKGASMNEAHSQGLIHRIAYVLIEDEQGKLLLQKRSLNVAVYKDCWDVAASGHVDEGESYEQAAYRELAEEVGLEGYELAELGGFYDETNIEERRLKRFCKVYTAQIPKGAPLNPDTQEVSEVRWFSLAEVQSMLTDNDALVAAGLRACATRYYAP